MATEHTLRLGIDGTGARQGAGTVVRSLDDIRKKAAETTTGIDKLEKAGKRLTSAGKTLTMFVTLPLTAAAAAFVKVASDAQETRAKFDAVFKGLSASTRAWARDLGAALGRNQVELEGFLARLQDTFVPLGFAREEAAELSKTLTVLATDLAAFDNIAESDALDLLTSAIVGNHEAVRRFGIIITESTIKAELLRMGVKGNAAAASDLEKVQARLNIIMRSSADAQGQAMREADGAANSFKALASASKDAAIALGERLLPVVVPMVKRLGEMLRGVADINPETVKWGLALAGVAVVVGPLATGIGMLALAVKALALAGLGVTAAWTGGLSVVVAALGAFWLKSKLDAGEAAVAVDKFKESLVGLAETQIRIRQMALAFQIDATRNALANTPARNKVLNPYAPGQSSTYANPEHTALAGQLTFLTSRAEALEGALKGVRDAAAAATAATGGGGPAGNPWEAFAGMTNMGPGLAIEQQARNAPRRPNGLPVKMVVPRDGGGTVPIGPDRSRGRATGLDHFRQTRDEAGGTLAMASNIAADRLGSLAHEAVGLLSSFTPLGLVAEVLGAALDAVRPAVEALMMPLQMLGKALGAGLLPIFEAMFPVFKGIAIAGTYVAQVFFNIAGGIAKAIGWLVSIVGKAVDALNGPFGGDGGLGKVGRGISSVGDGFLKAAGALGTARDEIKALEWDDAMKAVRDFTDAMTDVPKVINLALYRSRVTGTGPTGNTGSGSDPVGDSGSGGDRTRPDRREPVPVRIDHLTVINEAGDDELSIAKKVARGTQIAFSQGVRLHMPVVTSAL